MIRKIGKKLMIMKFVEVEEIIVEEKIVSVFNYLNDRLIRVSIESVNAEGVAVKSREVLIKAPDYDELLPETSDEGLGGGLLIAQDLWTLIDKIEEVNAAG